MRRPNWWQLGGSDRRPEPRSLALALKARYMATARKPTIEDAPPLSTFPGRKVSPIEGQLDTDGRTYHR